MWVVLVLIHVLVACHCLFLFFLLIASDAPECFFSQHLQYDAVGPAAGRSFRRRAAAEQPTAVQEQ